MPRAACRWLPVRTRLACCAIFLTLIRVAILAAEDDNALREKIDAAIVKGADALWKLQAEDGGWHSVTYGHLKPGVATTAFVLETLATIDKDRHAADFERAEKFLIAAQGKDGGLGTGGEWLELPTYSTALGIMAFAKLKPEGWEKTVEPWVKYLKAAQHSEDNGCKPEDPAYGGWAPEGIFVKGRGRNVNISATRYALNALAKSDARDSRRRARDFIRACQNYAESDANADGGFFFSPGTADLNKAGKTSDEKKFKSYGSATADGVLAMRSLGELGGLPAIPGRGSPGHEAWEQVHAFNRARKSAEKWLLSNATAEVCPGFDEKDKGGWANGLTHYFRAQFSDVLIGIPDANQQLATRFAQVTLAAPLPDGLWKNKSILMKEDDPLIATPLALKTLWNCKAALEPKKP